ncbi:YdeI/OmpD-associated family protein [Fluviicola taffensis]|uniref:Bacteriocin-protection protein, YdeI/OmpD-associated family n=1 Tax=Fluviicola taffensis (strain DSM 16823 / NCIMB 13979 / RW262) TaxID=755732 RepID=F2IET2_FLUTR|nr:YdeI/OmpD-associated family protein [Fluviicola taffensis]AEA45649.1 hypothetical protein Fluta_3681 [Fluviicola taffensis DSM 16823]
MKELDTFYPTSILEWRTWLEENHQEKQSIWVICYKQKSGIPSIAWSDAVDEALCFGWIDSTRKTLDEYRFIQYFGKRKAQSTWSKVNKGKIVRLIEAGKMTQAGLDIIELAKKNGSWNILDTVEELTIPVDLELEFETQPGSKDYFLSLSKSVRKMMLAWLVLAKRPETRQKRIIELVEAAAKNQKPKQF